MKIAIAVCIAAFAAVALAATNERQYQRIVGGSLTTINQYPYAVALLHNGQSGNTYWQSCGGTIITNFVVLSASHCFVTNTGVLHTPNMWRARVGSNFANSGGSVHNIQLIRNHPNYNRVTDDSDVSLLRTATAFVYNNNVAAASIAGSNYNLADNQQVWAIGWGTTSQNGSPSEQLRHVEIWTVNQATCNQRYSGAITANMLCSGWLDVGGRDQCQGDSGGPLIHNGVIVGVCSWGMGCAQAFFPGVNARVSTLSNWIVTNANSL